MGDASAAHQQKAGHIRHATKSLAIEINFCKIRLYKYLKKI